MLGHNQCSGSGYPAGNLDPGWTPGSADSRVRCRVLSLSCQSSDIVMVVGKLMTSSANVGYNRPMHLAYC